MVGILDRIKAERHRHIVEDLGQRDHCLGHDPSLGRYQLQPQAPNIAGRSKAGARSIPERFGLCSWMEIFNVLFAPQVIARLEEKASEILVPSGCRP